MLLWAVLSGFLLAFAAPFLRRLAGPMTGWLLALLPAALFLYFLGFLDPVSQGGPVKETTPWVPLFGGIDLSFYVDGLSLMFALLISGIGTFILLYAGAYLKGHDNLGRFMGFLLAFMASMLGLVLADNVVTLFFFWEMTSITSFLLIGFSHHRVASRRAAVQALVVTGGGGLIMLAGLLLFAGVGGTYEISELLTQGDLVRNHGLYVPILILVLFGAFTKSAQVPFHFWLPNAMEAPTPVSAYLHSATMVKAGVYLIARFNPALGGTALWETTLTVFGALTFLSGTVLGLRQTDLKLMLAYTTVASLGLLVMLIGLGSDKAIIAAMAYLLAHSLFKGALFMVAGGIDHATGTRDGSVLGGLATAMPITAAAGLLAVLSMAGLPPFIGFLAKEVIYKATGGVDFALVITLVAVIGNILMGGIAALAGLAPFIGPRMPTPKPPHEGSPSMWLGALTLAICGLGSALMLHWTEVHLLAPATAAVVGETVKLDLHLWAGVNLPLILSVITVAGAVLVFLYGRQISDVLSMRTRSLWGPDQGYDQALKGVRGLAGFITGLFQTGSLQFYTFVTFAVLAVLLALPLVGLGVFGPPNLILPDFYVTAVLVVAAIVALATVFLQVRLHAVLAAGMLGTMVALLFLLHGAPDLAFTQVMVETLSVVILALVLLGLPVDEMDRRPTSRMIRDGAVSIVIGVSVTFVLFAVTAQPLDMRLTDFFNAASYTEAYGKNIVNVILVDFRALDTLGEIAVVMVAGVSALALLGFAGTKLRAGSGGNPKPDTGAGPDGAGAADGAARIETSRGEHPGKGELQ